MSETQEKKTPRKKKVTLLKNIKHDHQRYKIGEEIEVDAKTAEEFAARGIAK